MRNATKPRYHHGALEQALVDEALRQIRERGADQVSLRGLAQAVGVSPSAAYQHFPDKAALMVAVCAAEGAELAERGLLRLAPDETAALDVLAWSLVHGFSSLMVEGHLPLEAGELVLTLFGRLVLTDAAFATFAEALQEQLVGR